MPKCFAQCLLPYCDMPGCQHKASFIVYISQLVIAGRYCMPHTKDKLNELKEKEKG